MAAALELAATVGVKRAAKAFDVPRATLYAAHPERFVRKRPEPLTPPTAAWINPPPPAALTEAPH
jgi:hypothetical protein